MIDRRLAAASALVPLLAAPPAAAQTPDISDRLQFCQSCHGEAGLPQQPDTPIIWGCLLGTYFLWGRWDDAGWQSFVSDPTVPAVMKEAGHLGKPYTLAFQGAVEA